MSSGIVSGSSNAWLQRFGALVTGGGLLGLTGGLTGGVALALVGAGLGLMWAADWLDEQERKWRDPLYGRWLPEESLWGERFRGARAAAGGPQLQPEHEALRSAPRATTTGSTLVRCRLPFCI